MMIRLLKTYTISVTIQEGNDEFWEEILADEKTGADEVVEAVRDALHQVGFQAPYTHVRLSSFDEKAPMD